jgi:hypothetical protein
MPTIEQAQAELRRRQAQAELERRRRPADYGMVAIPRKKLPGAWDYDKRLDQLLGDNEYSLDELAPLDVRYRIGRITGMTEKPDENKARMENSLYYSIMFNELPKVTFNLVDELNKIAFKNPIDVRQATKRYKDYYRDRKKYMAAIEDGLKNLGVRLLKVPVGAAKMEAEMGGKVRDWAWKTLLKREKPNYLKEMDKTLAEWSDTMYAAIGEYYRENKDQMIDILPGLGFMGTLKEYATRPELFVQSLVESMGIVLEGTAGTLIGGPAGGILTMGIPLMFEVYPDVRAEGTEPLPALGQSMLTGMGEAVIEQWTLSKKLGLMKNFKKYVSEGLPKMLWEGTKVYFRGTAEEGTQEFNRNFWNWVFTDRSQQWSDNVAESMAIGGPMELAMAGGFSAVGAATGAPIAKEQKELRLDQIQEQVKKSPLPKEHKAEILEVIDDARFEADFAEMERELAEIQETAMVEVKPTLEAEPTKIEEKYKTIRAMNLPKELKPRRRYNRASTNETLQAAYTSAKEQNKIKYVYATALGMTISNSEPLSQPHFLVRPDGTVETRISQWQAEQMATILGEAKEKRKAEILERHKPEIVPEITKKIQDLDNKLRQRIHAIAAKKGLTKKALSDLRLPNPYRQDSQDKNHNRPAKETFACR